jgi:hypothetical protein
MFLSKAYSKYGASMGRRDYIEEALPRDTSARFNLETVRINQGGYDSGGAYWGTGMALWRAQEREGGTELFFRAPSRDAAKAKVRERFPNARFYK